MLTRLGITFKYTAEYLLHIQISLAIEILTDMIAS